MSNDYPLTMHGFAAVVQLGTDARSSRARIAASIRINRTKEAPFCEVVTAVKLDRVNTEVKLKVFLFPVTTEVKKVATERY